MGCIHFQYMIWMDGAQKMMSSKLNCFIKGNDVWMFYLLQTLFDHLCSKHAFASAPLQIQSALSVHVLLWVPLRSGVFSGLSWNPVWQHIARVVNTIAVGADSHHTTLFVARVVNTISVGADSHHTTLFVAWVVNTITVGAVITQLSL